MKLSAILAPMIAAGVPGDVILETVKAFEEQQHDALEKRRESDRNRQAAKRERDVSHVTSRDVTVTVPSRAGVTRVEDITSNSEISGEDIKTNTNAPKARGVDLADFKAELSDLDSERVEAIVKHRRSKRGQLTGLSARLFRKDAEACGLSMADAVDTCISRNWLTVKPEYLAGKQQPRAHAPPPSGKPTVVDAMHEIFRERGWSTDEPEQLPSHHRDGELLSAGFGGGTKGTVVDLREGSWRRTGSGD
ncbi:MAG TPA: hypothetical protein VJL90_12780 [Pseudorhodoplanes sp.]|nr:hypothetical protein [Pseudorhodoplanes sp.]